MKTLTVAEAIKYQRREVAKLTRTLFLRRPYQRGQRMKKPRGRRTKAAHARWRMEFQVYVDTWLRSLLERGEPVPTLEGVMARVFRN